MTDGLFHCPGCGAHAPEETSIDEVAGRVRYRLRCHACGKPFIRFEDEREKPGVVTQSDTSRTVRYLATPCPFCRKTNNVVTGTKSGEHLIRRQHQCRACGRPFNSYEPLGVLT